MSGQGTPVSSSRRALVAGAGLAGLTAALRLGRTGWDVVLVEEARAPRRGGAAFTVDGPAFDAVERLGLADVLRERHFVPTEITYLRPDGTPRFAIAEATLRRLIPARAVHVLRDDLTTVLEQAAMVVTEIRYGVSVVDIEQNLGSVTVSCSDGRTETVDVVVKATGAAVPAGVDEGGLAVVMLSRAPSGLAEHAVTVTSVHGGDLALLGLGDRGAVAQLRHHAGVKVDGSRTLHTHWHGLLDSLGGAAAEVLARLDTSGPVYECSTNVPTGRWSSGRVVALGDGAWGSTPSGAGLAISGAYALGTVLQDRLGHVPSLLRMWETGLRPGVEQACARPRRPLRRRAPGVTARLWRHGLELPF